MIVWVWQVVEIVVVVVVVTVLKFRALCFYNHLLLLGQSMGMLAFALASDSAAISANKRVLTVHSSLPLTTDNRGSGTLFDIAKRPEAGKHCVTLALACLAERFRIEEVHNLLR